MLRTRFGLLGLSLAVVLSASASRADDEKRTDPEPARRQRPDRDRPTFRRPFGQVVSPRVIEELGLSGEQKAKVEKITAQYEKKYQDASEKVREEVRKARGNPDASTKLREKLREHFQAMRKAREDARAAVKAVLNDEQKKKFEELQRRRSRFPRPGDRSGFRPGQVLPPFLQERLELTAEQKKQLEKLQADVNERLNKILTEEQRQRLEGLRRFGGRDGDRPNRRDRPDRPPQERD